MSWLTIGIGAAIAAITVIVVRRSMASDAGSGGGVKKAGNPSIASLDMARANALTAAWTDIDFKTLDAMSKRLKMNTPDLLLVLTSESGLKPTAVYRRASDGFPVAVGLNQLTSAANGAAGITEVQRVELLEKPVSFQLPIIERMFSNMAWTKSGKSYDNAGVIYAMNFAPSRVVSRGTALTTVLYEQGKDGVFYDQNKQLDTGKKGKITVGDLVEYMRRVSSSETYKAGLTRLRAAVGGYGGGGAGGAGVELGPKLPVV